MSFELIVVFLLILLAMVLFATEIVSFDTVALTIAALLMITGILTTAEGLSGFSNPATVTIGAMFVISEGVRKTGILESVSAYLATFSRFGFYPLMLILMIVIAVISAMINNTAAVVIFIPVLMKIAEDINISPSKLLMPLSFASMFGGVCSLIGTSTNILVSSIAQDHGLKPIGMFEMTPMGAIILVAGFVYILTVGIRIIPPRRKIEELSDSFGINQYLTEIVIDKNFEFIDQTIGTMLSGQGSKIQVVNILRDEHPLESYINEIELREGDVLRLKGNADQVARFVGENKIKVNSNKHWYDVDLQKGRSEIIEAVVAPESAMTSKKISEIDLFKRFGAILIGIRNKEEMKHADPDEIRLAGGDSLLLFIGSDQIRELRRERSFVVMNDLSVQQYRRKKIPFALAILAGVIIPAAFDLVPIVASAGAGVVLMIITGCIKSDEIPRAVNWKIIFLLAGIIPLGTAMEKTGAAKMISDGILNYAGDLGPTFVLSAFFLVTFLLTAMISNQATAALLTPVAIQAAHTLGVSPRPLVLAVAFAASLSFMTPMGYQTNTLVYGPGRYKFKDYTLAGAPLNLLLWVLCSFLIPVFWPFSN